MQSIVLIAHDIRSCHNVGSLLRTAEGIGVDRVYLTGYTPYPRLEHDDRLPHLATKIDSQISKTALGAELTQAWERHTDIKTLIRHLKSEQYHLIALEQSEDSVALPDFTSTDKLAILLGREVEGIDNDLLAFANTVLEIPMYGSKESFNVVQAAAMTLYHCRFMAGNKVQ